MKWKAVCGWVGGQDKEREEEDEEAETEGKVSGEWA